jgi:hypothetical protein
MVESGMGGSGEVRKNAGTNWQKVLLPIVGLIVIAGAIAVGAIASGSVATWAKKTFNLNIARQGNIDPIQIASGLVIFIVIMMVFALVYAAIAPKPPRTVNEAQLDKEKKARIADEQRRKRTNRQMKDRMRQRNKTK